VASDPQAAGRGVLVVMGDRVFAARDVRKVRTRGSEAFRGFPRESLGLVSPSALEWFGAPWRPNAAARFAWVDELPEVAVIHAHAGLTGEAVERMVGTAARGVVMAGVGEGNFPEAVRAALRRMRDRGVFVVRASRAEEGLVDREPDDDSNGFVAARALNPQKARLLLQVLIANEITDLAAIQRAFDGN